MRVEWNVGKRYSTRVCVSGRAPIVKAVFRIITLMFEYIFDSLVVNLRPVDGILAEFDHGIKDI